jgi:hypothetical protein
MGEAFSRRALYRHRAKHMVFSPSPAARPIPFPQSGSTLQRLKWVQLEVEHTASLAEFRGDIGSKLKALYLLGRLLWLESRLSGQAKDVTPDPAELQYQEFLRETEEAYQRRLEEAGVRRENALHAQSTQGHPTLQDAASSSVPALSVPSDR